MSSIYNYLYTTQDNSLFLSMTSIVPWGSSFGSALGMRRFSKVLRNIYSLTPFYRGLMVGMLLSDTAVIRGTTSTSNWRLNFEQSFTRNFSYFMHIFKLLLPFTRSLPIFRVRLPRADTSFGYTYSLTLITIALPCIT